MKFETLACSDAVRATAHDVFVRRVKQLASQVSVNTHVWAGAILCVLMLQASLVIIHEPWADEWQALQIALLSPDIGALLENLRYEGHPPLWYFLLRFIGIFAHPLSVLMIAQLAIALSIQALVLLCLSLPKWQRLCVALSYFLLIEYGTLSRSHSLGTLVLIAFFVVRHAPLRWTAIAILPMIDFQFGLLSVAAIAIMWRAGSRSSAGLACWLASALLAAWSVLPAADMIAAQYPSEGITAFVRAISLLSSQLLPFHVFLGRIDWGFPWPGALGFIMGILFIWMGDLILRHNCFHRIIFHGFVWSCIMFSSFIYAFGVRHLTLAPILLILLVSTGSQSTRGQRVLFKIWIASAAGLGIFGAGISFAMPFDVSDKAAAFIKARGLERENWVAWPDFTGTGLASRLQLELGSIKKDCTQAFNRWNADHRFDGAESMAAAFEGFADKHGSFYVSTPFRLNDVGAHIPMREIAFFPAGYNHYEIWLYQVAYDRKKSANIMRRCKPLRLPISAWADPDFRYGFRF